MAIDELTLEARGGVGMSGMITAAQREQGFRSGFVPDLRPALRVADAFAVELAVSSWFFPRDQGTGRATMFGGGLRYDPRLTSWLSWFADGHGGVALTGPANRFMADAGTGFEIWISRGLAVGPYVRYGHVVDAGPDPRFWAAGLCATMTWSSGSDEPPSLGPSDPDRDERQREWQRSRQRELQSPRYRDRDRDGVVDERDICPDERQGRNPDPNMLGCPRTGGIAPASISSAPADRDRDGDGVPDRDDKCPDRSFGQNPDPLAMGCPLADRDRDGIPDLNDACPTRAGVADTREKANGCPGLARIEGRTIQLSRPIAFTGGEDIHPGSVPVLQAVAAIMRSMPEIKKVSIEGHTDGTSSANQGFEASERRAESVRRWLENNGVEAYRLASRGFGDTRPVASNRTAKGRSANARIELVILEPSNGVGLP